ncbi:MAG: hypothetical protein ABIR80_00795, partial [Opitutaceae bacterium]
MRWLLSFAIVLFSSCAHFDQRSFPDRKTRQVGAFTIEYSAGDEANANLLASLLQLPKLNSWAAKPVPLSLADLERRREYFLVRVAAVFGHTPPPPMTVAAYDGFLRAMPVR